MSDEENKQAALDELKVHFNKLNIPLTTKEVFNEKYNYYKENWRNLI